MVTTLRHIKTGLCRNYSHTCTKNFTISFSLQEHYVEYSRHGTIIKGHERAKVKSIYEEDVYLNNHSVRLASIGLKNFMMKTRCVIVFPNTCIV